MWFSSWLLGRLVEDDRAADGFEHGGGDGAGAVEDDMGPVGGRFQTDDGGFDADGGGASVEDGVDAVVEVFEDMRDCGGADAAEAVGAGSRDGEAGGFDKGEGDWVGGHADADERTACGDVVGDLRCAREKEGQSCRARRRR